MILDGAGLATNVTAVGNDSRLNGTLIAVHDYSFFVDPPYESETDWGNQIAGMIGNYASRTVATEWGAPMSPGSKNGVHYDTIDYSIPSGSFFADYVRGISSELRSLGMGSVYWPGLRDGDWYSLTTRTGSGAGIRLSLTNASGLARLQYAWGLGNAGGTYVVIRNGATGLYVDGLGRTATVQCRAVRGQQQHQSSSGRSRTTATTSASRTGPPASTWTARAARPTARPPASTATPTASTNSGRSPPAPTTSASATAPPACSSTGWGARPTAPTGRIGRQHQHQPAVEDHRRLTRPTEASAAPVRVGAGLAGGQRGQPAASGRCTPRGR